MDAPDHRITATKGRAFSWRMWRPSVGFLLVSATLASVVSLAVVASLRDVDVLSVVALALAILAFLMQLIIFAAQTFTSTQLNAQTSLTMSEVQEAVREMRALITQQFDYLLRSLVERGQEATAASEAAGEDESAAADAEDSVAELQRLREEVRAVLETVRSRPSSPLPHIGAEPSVQDREIIARLRTYPGEAEAQPLLDTFSRLSLSAHDLFSRLARNEYENRRAGRRPGMMPSRTDKYASTRDELFRAGLIETDPDSQTGRYRLTPFGREVARIVMGAGPWPSHIAERLQPQSDAPSEERRP